MWRSILPYVVLALIGLASLSLLVMLFSILRAFVFKHLPKALARRRRSIYVWAFTSLVLIAALVASGFVMIPRTTRLNLVPARPPESAGPARPAPARMSPGRLWSQLVGDFVPFPSGTRTHLPAEPRTGMAPARPAPPPVQPPAPPAAKKPAPAMAAPGPGTGWTQLLAGLTLPRPEPTTTPLPPPKVVLPSTAPETQPLQVPPPKPSAATPARPTPPPGPRSTPPTVVQTPARVRPAPARPQVKPTSPPPARPAAEPRPTRTPKHCWALSTDSFRSRERALSALRQRRKLGLKPFPLTRVRVKGKWWYRVIVGCFSTRQAAQRYARRLHKNGLTRDVPQVLRRPNPEARGGP